MISRRALPLLALTLSTLSLSAMNFACARSEALPSQPRRPAPVPSMFNPVRMELHPVFTRLKAWDPNHPPTYPDGVEVEVGFYDRFGDPVKAEGRVIFELSAYRTDSADVRGRRITNPFVGSLATVEDQRARWSGPTRTYRFQLAYPYLKFSESYVLTATFDPKAGERFYSRIILQPDRRRQQSTPTALPALDDPATLPTTLPTTSPATQETP